MFVFLAIFASDAGTSELRLSPRFAERRAACPYRLPRGMGTPPDTTPMPRYYPNTHFSDCWASAGNITFYHRDGKCWWRSRSTLTFAGTPAQLASLEVHRRALAAWRTLPQHVQMEWSRRAAAVEPHRPPFGTGAHISGHNLFVSAYHGFCTLGREHIPEPVDFRPFPDFCLKFLDASVQGDADLALSFRLSVPDGTAADGYALLCKLQLAPAGKGCNPGKMRNFLAEDVPGAAPAGTSSVTEPELSGTVEARTVAVTVPDYTAFTGTQGGMYSLHLRYLLIDRLTGYRSRCRKMSCTVDTT